jgi:L-lactate dehydrogenase complex protein LldG
MTETRETSNNGNAREAILASIRQSLAASEPFDHVRNQHHGRVKDDQCPEKPVRPAIAQESLIENFKVNLESIDGYCIVAKNENEARDHLRVLINRKQTKRIAISNSDLVKRISAPIDGVELIENASADVLFGCDLGVTGSQWAVAETGTLILQSDVENHRLTSLVPPVHLCILKADRIRQTLGEILELTSVNLSRTITFITGASRTSDIELTLAIGVHGPAELHVIIIADQENHD